VNALPKRRLAGGAVLLAAVLVAGPAGAGLPPAADDSGPTAPRATSPPPTPSSRAVAALRDETSLVPAGPVSSPRPLRPAPVPVPQARLYGRAPVDAVIPTTVVRKQHRKKPKKPPPARPLQVTPPLDGGPYIFPVAGTASFGDTYGGLRSDVPGGWHHGDDIFAPLGTPVVAVADGTVNRAGWERVGGWRLWVRDDDGDEFYYAHLSGYARVALADGRVHRGEVIGFVGNTGDAFATLPHLHFEVHPRSLLRLKYDGAVDPTTYLQSWPRPTHVVPPAAVHPRFPRATAARYEATTNFRELLRVLPARPRTPAAKPRPVPPPVVARPVAPPHPLALAPPPAAVASASSSSWRWAATDAIAAVAVLGLMMWRQSGSRRRSPAEARLDAAMAAARAELEANLATLRAVRRAVERSRRPVGRPLRLPVRTR